MKFIYNKRFKTFIWSKYVPRKPQNSLFKPNSLISSSFKMDRGSYEKLSIRDSARSLKKYGSTSKTRNDNYLKHYVTQTDTLQGIALKYNVTIEQIRRANRLYASDSLFLKEYLLIPITQESGMTTPFSSTQSTPIVSPTQTAETPMSTTSSGQFDDDNISDFLSKIDASIACTKEDVKKTRKNSE